VGKMNRYVTLTLFISAFFFACVSPKKSEEGRNNKKWYISVEETACFGSCPIYKIVLDGSGRARMYGKRFVEPLGVSTATVSNTLLASLVNSTATAKWGNYEEAYISGYSDWPSTIVCYSIIPGDTFTVTFQNRLAPAPVTQLADSLISLRKRAGWISQTID
jgi:hypothetical protein